MVAFVLLAAALTVGGVMLVAIPLLRRAATPAATAPAPWAAMAAAALLVIGSAVLYVSWSKWSWRDAPAADTPQSMVARLARQLEHNPQNLDGWMMLGRSYVTLQEYPLALRAFERADRLSDGKNAEALTGEAEALALTDESELTGRAGRLIERALAISPDSGKALFFGAAVAERRGDLALARARFAKLLSLNPPADVRPIIEQQITTLDARLAGAAATPAAAAASPMASVANSATAVVRVDVSLAPALAAAAGSAPLFVFVRDPGQPGPPLAVKRLESHFPQSVSLSSSDAMMPGRVFKAGQSVQVVARIARSGNPVGASGDPLGQVNYQVGRDGLVSLVIDHLMP
jgi:cytochrome c-type biogenesis protein CcmH